MSKGAWAYLGDQLAWQRRQASVLMGSEGCAERQAVRSGPEALRVPGVLQEI